MRGSFEDRGNLVVVERGNDRPDQHPHRYPGSGKRFDGFKSLGRRGGSRFHYSLQLGSEAGDRDATDRSMHATQLREEIHIAGDELILGYYADWISRVYKDLQTTAGELELALDRLIGVGHSAYAQRLRFPFCRCELLTQEERSVFFDEDLRLKVQTSREAQVLVIRPGVAIDAPVFTTAI